MAKELTNNLYNWCVENNRQDLLEEWNNEKNINVTPGTIAPRSNQKVWWKCNRYHEWEACPNHRTNGRGCPECAKGLSKSLHEYEILYYLSQVDNGVIHSYKDLGFELDIYIPSKNTAIEYDGIRWHKDKENNDKTKNKKCKNHEIVLFRLRENELGMLNDTSIDVIVNKKNYNITLQNLIYELYKTHIDVDVKRDKYNILKLRDELDFKNSIVNTHPDLVKEWDFDKNKNININYVSAGCNKKVWWKMPYDDPRTGKHFDFEWESTIGHRTAGRGCPYLPTCSSPKVYPGFNDLETLYPELAKEWDYEKNGDLLPSMFTSGSNQKVWWKLDYDVPEDYPIEALRGKHFNFEWQATISHRTSGENCPYFTGRTLYPGFNDLESTYPNIAKDWNYEKNGDLKPNQVAPKSNQKVWWKLPYDVPEDYPIEKLRGKHFNFEWQATINSRTSGIGCPYLSGGAVWSGFNDLLTTHHSLTQQWDYEKNDDLRPENVSAGSNKKVWWKCKNGHEWENTIVNRSKYNVVCPLCRKRDVK